MRRPHLFTMRMTAEERQALVRVANRLGLASNADAVRFLVSQADPRKRKEKKP